VNRFTTDPGYFAEQYESLRREVTADAFARHRGPGLFLFLTRGLVAWLEAVSCLAGAAPSPSKPRATTVPLSAKSDLSRVLADMVLVCMQEGAR
jgi:hypothetical protein